MMQGRIRIGVIGAGGEDRWGARAHVPAVAALPEAELTAVCTAHQDTALRAQERTGARLAFWNLEEMLRSREIDLVTVAVRIASHHPIVMKALAAEKHVLCEWPLALDPDQATEMLALARQQGVGHAVSTQARFSPGIAYARELIAEGRIGRPLLFNLTHFLSTSIEPRPSHRLWLTQADQGGGAILIATGHALDALRWCLGDVLEVTAKIATLVTEARFSDSDAVAPVDAVDTVACMARLSDGTTGTVHVSNVCRSGSGFRLEVYGTAGRLLVEAPNMVQYTPARVFTATTGGAFAELPVPGRFRTVHDLAADDRAMHLAELLRAFIASIREERTFHPDFADALGLHHVIEAVTRSSASGQWEAVA